MTNRISCKTPDCSGTILPVTAERTGGYCMPCVQAAARKEHEAYVRANRRDVNEFEGMTDRVEILKLIHKPRKFDELVNWIPYPMSSDKVYSELNEDEQIRLIEYAKSLIGTDRNNDAEEILLCLGAFTDADLTEVLRLLVAKRCYWPSLIFHRSPTDVRDALLREVEIDAENRNLILIALAWIGDAVVVERFKNWRVTPPSWSDELYVAPEMYAQQAGWELSEDGQRRDLYLQQCYELKKGASTTPESFMVIRDRDDECPWCQTKLVSLLTVAPQTFDLKFETELFEVATCVICTAYGTVYGTFNGEGEAQWSSKNNTPGYLPDDTDGWGRLPIDALTVGKPRSALFAADWQLPTTYSQLGGHPTWVQDAEYPKCPDCSKSMVFIGQIANDEIQEHTEGTYYTFVCSDCRTTATTYQQT